MKRRIAVLLAVIIGFTFCPSGAAAMAAENEGIVKVAEQEPSGLKNLQIPQKLDVVIDPWEVDRKGQVYSEQYIISNTGEVPGILTLSNLTCRPREQSGVVVRTDRAGLHDSGDKSIYMEMQLGNGEQIVFSQENSQYQTELNPGEELSICFAGEVNENAFGKWENNDVSVSVVYSWEITEQLRVSDGEENVRNEKEGIKEEIQPGESEEKSQKQKQEDEPTEADADNPEKETSDNVNIDTPSKNPESYISEETTEQETSKSEEAEGDQKTDTDAASCDGSQPDTVDKEKEEIKNIDLSEPQKINVVIDSWKTDEKGRIVSAQYLLRNIGDTAGIWDLSELVCKPLEQSEVAVKTDKSYLNDSEEKSVYMELIAGNEEKIVLSSDGMQYKVELKPGEELSIRFVGEMNGNLFENREEGDIAVTAVCTWSLE